MIGALCYSLHSREAIAALIHLHRNFKRSSLVIFSYPTLWTNFFPLISWWECPSVQHRFRPCFHLTKLSSVPREKDGWVSHWPSNGLAHCNYTLEIMLALVLCPCCFTRSLGIQERTLLSQVIKLQYYCCSPRLTFYGSFFKKKKKSRILRGFWGDLDSY